MATMVETLNPAASVSIHLERELAGVARQLRLITVQVHKRGAGGSGVVWRSDGLIITNAHVVGGASDLSVFDGQHTHRAEVIGRDGRRDLAALKIEASGLTAAALRDLSSLRPGQLVLAVGNPMDGVGAVSQGVLHSAPASGWIEADIRLAPGNSGGPLADAEGRVIGISSRIEYGLAVAVATDVVERFVAGLNRPRIGVTVQPAYMRSADNIAAALHVIEVEAKSPAHLAGIRPGDVLVRAGEKPLGGVDDLSEAISAAGSGTLLLEVNRGGAPIRLDVQLRK